MNLTEKASYIKGLAEGLALDNTTKEGKILAALLDLVDEMSHAIADIQDDIEEIDSDIQELHDYAEELDDDLNDMWLSRTPVGNGMPTITANPIQYLYDKYNASARRQATLKRNRKMYNEVLREQGRTDELLPDSLDFVIEYNMYESAETRKPKNVFDTTNMVGKAKPMVPRKKYIHFGN